MSDTDTPAAKPLLEGTPDLPALSDRETRDRAIADDALRPSAATAKDVAGRMYVDGDAAVDAVLARYAETGDAAGIASQLEREPAQFGDLQGATRLGLANAERRNALEWAPQLAARATDMMELAGRAGREIVADHEAQRAARAKPLSDLSQDAQRFLGRAEAISKQPMGEEKVSQMRDLLKDSSSINEIQSFRRSLSERYGRSQSAIREGVSADSGFREKSQPERTLTMVRINAVLTSFPRIAQMQTQVKAHDRSRDMGKDQSRGIER